MINTCTFRLIASSVKQRVDIHLIEDTLHPEHGDGLRNDGKSQAMPDIATLSSTRLNGTERYHHLPQHMLDV